MFYKKVSCVFIQYGQHCVPYGMMPRALYCAKNACQKCILFQNACQTYAVMEYPQELEVIMVSRMWVQPVRCWSAVECRGSTIIGSLVHNQRAERLTGT